MADKKVTPKVSVVITVLNEENTVRGLLTSLQKQTLQPAEIIIVDGGSSDRTLEIIRSFGKKIIHLRVLSLPGANRSRGRNYGVSRSKNSLIAFTDAGCTPEADWLKNLIRPFSDPQIQVVSGYYRGTPRNIFEKCLVPYTLVMPDQAGKEEFFPATRSMAITRSAWDKSGGFDPKLSFNEDYAYAHWLKKIGYSFHFSPSAVVNWYPRKNLREAAKMFFYFALGDIQAGIFRPRVKNLIIRYLIILYLLVLSVESHFFFLITLPLMFIYLVWSVLKNYRYVGDIRAVFWLPLIQVTADISVLWGTLIGFLSKAYGIF